METCYVIQFKQKDGGWLTWWKAPFDTLAQAKEFRDLFPGNVICRIAEVGTATIYRPVKEA